MSSANIRASGDGADDVLLPKKKTRRRLRVSCVECTRRRQKCDRQQPCTLCKTRGVEHLCKWAPEPFARPPPARPPGRNTVKRETESESQTIPPAVQNTTSASSSTLLQDSHHSQSNTPWHSSHSSPSSTSQLASSARSSTSPTQAGDGLREVVIALSHMQLSEEDRHLGEGSFVCAIQELTDTTRLSSSSLFSSRRKTSTLILYPSEPYNPVLPYQDHCTTLLRGFLDLVNWSIGVPNSIILSVYDAMWAEIGPEQRGLVDFSPNWLSLLFAMLAASPRCGTEAESRRYFNQSVAAKKLEEDRLYPSLSPPGACDSRGAVYSCLAASFIAKYLQDRGQVKEAWRFISNGLRQAQDAGLHRFLEPGMMRHLSEDERTFMLVTWHLCVEFDRFLSLFLGKPATIRGRDYNIQPPAPRMDTLAMNGTTNTALLFQHYFISLLTTVGNAKERFLCSSPDLQEDGHIYFDRSMGEWLTTLPAFYSLLDAPDMSRDNLYPRLHSQRLTLKAYYLSSCLLFHRALAYARPEYHAPDGYGVASYYDHSLLAQYAINVLYSHSELLYYHSWERQIPFDISMHMFEAALTLVVSILRDMRNVNARTWHRELARAIDLFAEMQARDFGTIVKQALQMLRGLQDLCYELEPKAITYIPDSQGEHFSLEGYNNSFMPAPPLNMHDVPLSSKPDGTWNLNDASIHTPSSEYSSDSMHSNVMYSNWPNRGAAAPSFYPDHHYHSHPM